MANKIGVKILFFGLVIATAFAGGLLYKKTTAIDMNAPAAYQPNNPAANATVNITPEKTPIMRSDAAIQNAIPPATAATPPLANNPAPTPAPETCIITIDGQKYDVQPLRFTHTGGDIFQCGTDMSAVFHGQHGYNMQMIQRYLVK